MLPAAILGVRLGGGRRGTLHSVLGRFRWGMMWRASIVIIPIYVLVIGSQKILFPPADLTWHAIDSQLVVIAGIILPLGPVQCAAEEYVFRGLPQQGLGVWLRSPWWGILVPVPFFVLIHGYGWAGQIHLAVLTLSLGFLAWKSGGLELPILVHTANNMPFFALGLVSPSILQEGGIDPVTLLFLLPLTLGVTVGLSVWVSRRHGIGVWEPVRSQTPVSVTERPSV